MSVQSHLDSKASSAVLSQDEKDSIATSIATLKTRLSLHFNSELKTHFRFGSSTRDTIIPRLLDEHSDIDYMIVFEDESFKPQTYVDQLKRFAKKYYYSSEIAQSHPTVVLELKHIKFDLVPAIKSYLDDEEYRIPASSKNYEDWTWTHPNSFNSELSAANQRCNYKLKPCIRLLKVWNARVGYVFNSYLLEQWVAKRNFFSCTATKDYFFNCIENLPVDWNAAQWQKNRINRAQEIVHNTKSYEANGDPSFAEQEIKKLIP